MLTKRPPKHDHDTLLTVDAEGNDLGEPGADLVIGLAQVPALVAAFGATHQQGAVLEAGHAPLARGHAREFT